MKKNRDAKFQAELNRAEDRAREENQIRDNLAKWEESRWEEFGWGRDHRDNLGWMPVIESAWNGGLSAFMYDGGDAFSFVKGKDEMGKIQDMRGHPIGMQKAFLLQSILEGISERDWGFCKDEEEIDPPQKISIWIDLSKDGERMIELEIQWEDNAESQFYASYLDCIHDLQSKFYYEGD